MNTIIITLITALIGSIGAVFLKRAAPQIQLTIKSIITNYNLIIGIALYGISMIIFFAVLPYGKITTLYPLLATAYIWTSILSMIILKEKMNWIKWAGVLLIVGGITLIGVQ